MPENSQLDERVRFFGSMEIRTLYEGVAAARSWVASRSSAQSPAVECGETSTSGQSCSLGGFIPDQMLGKKVALSGDREPRSRVGIEMRAVEPKQLRVRQSR